MLMIPQGIKIQEETLPEVLKQVIINMCFVYYSAIKGIYRRKRNNTLQYYNLDTDEIAVRPMDNGFVSAKNKWYLIM